MNSPCTLLIKQINFNSRHRQISRFLLSFVVIALAGSDVESQTAPKSPDAVQKNTGSGNTAAEDKTLQDLIKLFEERMSGSRLIGKFTISGRENDNPQDEEYHILKVKKLDRGDFWEFQARIKYGDHDVTVPLVLEVKWAGNTPVITVDKLFIPGMGTFDARVLLRRNSYAGTWSHDSITGHLFGRIEKLESPGDANAVDKNAEKDKTSPAKDK
jgi:hypothetical protein